MNYIATERFIEKARKIHGDRYDYSKVDYVNNHTKVCIICPIHGEFWQTPSNHIHNTHPRGCSKCNGGVPLTMDEFLSANPSVKEYIKVLAQSVIKEEIDKLVWRKQNQRIQIPNCWE